MAAGSPAPRPGPRSTPSRHSPPRSRRAAIHSLIASLAVWTVAVISGGGYVGVALLMALESACLPIPSEIIMPFAGYLVSTGRFDLFLVATAGAIGCNLGSAVAYAVGAYGGRRFIERYGRYVLLDMHELARVDRLFARYGNIVVFVSRLLPGVRTFIALPAGIARMRQLPFHVYTFLGSWPWCFALAYVGYKLGERWNTDPALRAAMQKFEIFVVVGAVLLLAVYIRWRWRNRAAPRPSLEAG